MGSQDPDGESSRPRCRRRRWIVAGVLLFVVSGAGWWWSWPRGDARFVGTWDWDSAVLQLNADLTGTLRVTDPTGRKVDLPSRWWIDGNLLYLDPWPRHGLHGVAYRLKDTYQRAMGMPDPDLRLTKFFLVEVRADEVVYRHVSRGNSPWGHESVLRRRAR